MFPLGAFDLYSWCKHSPLSLLVVSCVHCWTRKMKQRRIIILDLDLKPVISRNKVSVISHCIKYVCAEKNKCSL